MTDKRTDTRKDTLDEKAKPHTTPDTNEQIERKKALRSSGAFPPKPAPKDDDIEQDVERESWDRLKAEPRRNPKAPPYRGED